jgi:hypothetical protein
VPLLPKEELNRNYIESTKLAQGTFNEIESHNSFIEALNAWRGASTTPDVNKTPAKLVS